MHSGDAIDMDKSSSVAERYAAALDQKKVANMETVSIVQLVANDVDPDNVWLQSVDGMQHERLDLQGCPADEFIRICKILHAAITVGGNGVLRVERVNEWEWAAGGVLVGCFCRSVRPYHPWFLSIKFACSQ